MNGDGAPFRSRAGSRCRPGAGPGSEAAPGAAVDRVRGSVQKPCREPPSTGSMMPVRYDAAGESRNAAARPNSSGVP